MCWITTIFRKNVVKYLESKVCENGCYTMPRSGRFWPFSVGDSVQQANEIACFFIFYVEARGRMKNAREKPVPKPI